MSWPADSQVNRAIVTAYRDHRWTLRQCSHAFGPSVKTIAAILDRAGVPRRSPRERQARDPGPAEVAATLRYAQRGHTHWTEYGLTGGCDDPSTASAVFRQVICPPGPSRWIRRHLDGLLPCVLLPGGLFFWDITWLPAPYRPDREFYIVGPVNGWWYARPRGDGLHPGWCAPTRAELAARIHPHRATQITPSRRHA